MTAPVAIPEPAAERGRRRPLAVGAVVVIVLAITAMWIYAFFFASKTNPDQIPDTAWTQRAEATCQSFAAQLNALPPARDFKDIRPVDEAMRQRAVVGDQATDLLDQQLAALRADVPGDDYSRTAVYLWLADWDRYLAARRSHTAEWRAGRDIPFSEPPIKEGAFTPVSIRMDAFTKINRMTSCQVPQDMG